MARRRGRKGEYLASDDLTGFTHYRSALKLDYWNNLVKRPLLRNLQEIATPLNDPRPVPIYRGPVYEHTEACDFELQPLFIGTTNVLSPSYPSAQALGITPPVVGVAEVECTLVVFP